MTDQPPTIARALRALVVLLLALAPLVLAQGGPAEEAFTRRWNDKDLEWVSCPPFMPEGCGMAVLHGNPAMPNADVMLKLPAGGEVPKHWHTSPERMVVVAGELHLTYEGQSTTLLRPGAYAYGPSKAPHSVKCASKDPCVLFIALESRFDIVPVEPGK